MTPDLLFEYIVAIGVGITCVVVIFVFAWSMFFGD